MLLLNSKKRLVLTVMSLGLWGCGGGGGGNDAPVNQKPTAENMSVTLVSASNQNITLTAQDKDGDKLSYEIITMPQHGSLTGNNEQRIYTPTTNYDGEDQFTYRVSDGKDFSSTATVKLNVLASLKGFWTGSVAIAGVSSSVHLLVTEKNNIIKGMLALKENTNLHIADGALTQTSVISENISGVGFKEYFSNKQACALSVQAKRLGTKQLTISPQGACSILNGLNITLTRSEDVAVNMIGTYGLGTTDNTNTSVAISSLSNNKVNLSGEWDSTGLCEVAASFQAIIANPQFMFWESSTENMKLAHISPLNNCAMVASDYRGFIVLQDSGKKLWLLTVSDSLAKSFALELTKE